MKKLLLLGDEAIAKGALDAGMSGIYAYPGTPSTEITEYVQNSKQAKEDNIRSEWSVNEKTAMETALGMSYAGKRAMVCMKHVGMNVAADGFINSAITGANGGLIVTAADDPSMHSSQNEQDSRFYGKFAFIPTFEPSDHQEAYDMTRYGFDLSEKYEIPVLMRITTRLAHSRAAVELKDPRKQNEQELPENLKQFILLPSIARKQYNDLLEKQIGLEEESETSGFNKYFEGEDKSRGIIVCGLAYNYLMENYPDRKVPYPVLKISQYPLPRKMVEKITEECDEIVVMEEGMPIVEEMLKGFLGKGPIIRGRLDGTLPRVGELDPNSVAVALGMEDTIGQDVPDFVAGRPPQLCVGCPHIDSYNALNAAIAGLAPGRVFADIGCYTLGSFEPFNAINSCVDMGASITMAIGAADAGMFPAVAVIGDSTFTHSGITGLLDAVNTQSPITVLILDNGITAMTGCQLSAATGKIEDICAGLGVEEAHIRLLNPLAKHHEKNMEIMKEELAYKGVSVVIPRRSCVVDTRKLVSYKDSVKR